MLFNLFGSTSSFDLLFWNGRHFKQMVKVFLLQVALVKLCTITHFSLLGAEPLTMRNEVGDMPGS